MNAEGVVQSVEIKNKLYTHFFIQASTIWVIILLL